MSLKPKTWAVLSHAVEAGVEYGYKRAHKHDENPSEEQIKDTVKQAVLTEIAEWFDIVEENGEGQ